MDLSIPFRVMYQPRRAWERFARSRWIEPYFFLVALSVATAVHAYVGHMERIGDNPALLAFTWFYGFLFAVKWPVISAVCILVLGRACGGTVPRLVQLLSAMILCETPTYVYIALIQFFGVPLVSLGQWCQPFLSVQFFALGMCAAVTPAFVWTVVLWSIALPRLMHLQPKGATVLIGCLTIVNLASQGAFASFAWTLAG